MKPFAYHRPASLEEAIALLGGAAQPLAGGTDLVPLMKAQLLAPERVVAIRALLPEGVRHEAQGVTIGAATTLNDIEGDALVRQRYTALAQAAGLAATAQLRNVATLGGNLLQRPRCWYFRDARVHCWLKGGEQCQAREGENRQHAVFGASPCVSVHPSDLAPALLAFEAAVRLRGPRGERAVALEEFFRLPEAHRRSASTLGQGELLLEATLASHPPETRSVYLKAMDRQAFSFALAGVAAVLRVSARRRIDHARLVLGGVAPIPWRAHAAERALLGGELAAPLIEQAARAACEGAEPLALNGFKVRLVRALVKRALHALDEARGPQ